MSICFLPFGPSLLKILNQFPSNPTLTLVIFVCILVKISTTHMGCKLLGPLILSDNDSAPCVNSMLNPWTQSPLSFFDLIIDTIAKVCLLFLKTILQLFNSKNSWMLWPPFMVMSFLTFDQKNSVAEAVPNCQWKIRKLCNRTIKVTSTTMN